MCLILFGYRVAPVDPTSPHVGVLPLIVAANRDEHHARPSAAANYWQDHPHILAGRDLQAGGTWLGCTRQGRFAALTNFPNPSDGAKPLSRGLLVQGFLEGQHTGSDTAEQFAHALEGEEYAGFNLILFDGETLVYTSNKAGTRVLEPGYYGLSNAELGAPWPKCIEGAETLQTLAEDGRAANDLLALLRQTDVPPDERLPQRGRPLDMERRIAPSFIVGDEYGTRASTLVEIGNTHIRFTEQSFAANAVSGTRVDYELTIE